MSFISFLSTLQKSGTHEYKFQTVKISNAPLNKFKLAGPMLSIITSPNHLSSSSFTSDAFSITSLHSFNFARVDSIQFLIDVTASSYWRCSTTLCSQWRNRSYLPKVYEHVTKAKKEALLKIDSWIGWASYHWSGWGWPGFVVYIT